MKTLTLVLALSFHVLATSAHRSTPINPIRLPTADDAAAAAVASDSPMLDVDGNELRDHVEYYMLPFISGAGGGGVKLAHLDPADQCPTDAIQTPDSSDPGTAVVFIANGSTNTTILDPFAYQAVSFDDWTCIFSLSWKIQYDDGSKQHLVKVGEFENDLSYVFKVQRFRPNLNAYKITYCPGEDQCYNVGRYYDEESKNIRLALSRDPFVAVFKKSKE